MSTIFFLLCLIWNYLDTKLVSALYFDEKCYPVYGCFPTKYPYSFKRWNKALAPLPPDKLQVKLILSTRKRTKQVIENLLPNYQPIPHLDLDKTIKIIVPGFGSGDGTAEWVLQIRDVLLTRENCNVMVVTWKEYQSSKHYQNAVANIRMLGAVVGEFLCQLRIYQNYNLDMVHIYGHSLGAHASGYIGDYCNNKFREIVIGTITGLDPAGPLFEGKPEQARLDYKDAKFVLAMHTDAGKLYNNFARGIIQDVGHVDVYANDGVDQPGCTRGTLQIGHLISEISSEFFGNTSSCDHARATEYAIEWLNNTNCLWVGHWCTSWRNYKNGICKHHGTRNSLTVILGLNYFKKSKPKAGRYYLETNAKKPYCKPDYHF